MCDVCVCVCLVAECTSRRPGLSQIKCVLSLLDGQQDWYKGGLQGDHSCIVGVSSY